MNAYWKWSLTVVLFLVVTSAGVACAPAGGDDDTGDDDAADDDAADDDAADDDAGDDDTTDDDDDDDVADGETWRIVTEHDGSSSAIDINSMGEIALAGGTGSSLEETRPFLAKYDTDGYSFEDNVVEGLQGAELSDVALTDEGVAYGIGTWFYPNENSWIFFLEGFAENWDPKRVATTVTDPTDVAGGIALGDAGTAYLAGGYAEYEGQMKPWVRKIETVNGAESWSVLRGGPEQGIFYDIAVSSADTIHAIGRILQGDGNDIVIQVRDKAYGDLLNEITIDGEENQSDAGLAVAVADDGSIYTTGYKGFVLGGGFPETPELWIAKMSSGTSIDWELSMHDLLATKDFQDDIDFISWGDDVEVDADGNVYVAVSDMTENYMTGVGMLVYKLSPDGTLIWQIDLDVTSIFYFGGVPAGPQADLAIDSEGFVYLTTATTSGIIIQKIAPDGTFSETPPALNAPAPQIPGTPYWDPNPAVEDGLGTLSSNLHFEVCDEDDNLAGGRIRIYLSGTELIFSEIPWDEIAGGAPSAQDCGNPASVEAPFDDFGFLFWMADEVCFDLAVTDHQGNSSEKKTDICLTRP